MRCRPTPLGAAAPRRRGVVRGGDPGLAGGGAVGTGANAAALEASVAMTMNRGPCLRAPAVEVRERLVCRCRLRRRRPVIVAKEGDGAVDDDFDYLDSSRAPCLHRRRVRGGRTGGAHPRRHPGILNTKKRK